ncbi:MAG: hypothetical protein PHH04_00260 [Thomasclavelia sp.]|nr:hypothetical protein [Thomasclavelia sp.]
MIKGIYDIYLGSYDFGSIVDKIIVTLDSKVNIEKKDLTILETKQVCNTDLDIITTTTKREITKLTIKDNKLIIELHVDPTISSIIKYSFKDQVNSYSNPYYFQIESNLIDIDKEYKNLYSKADKFNYYQNKDYKYGFYNAHSDVMLVWLHGLGEGGTSNTNPKISILANKVTALTNAGFQDQVKASILVPQCPTYWLDETGKHTDFNDCLNEESSSSYYLDSLHSLINEVKEKEGIKKIIIAGCSNGGFMSMLLAKTYKDEYDAYIPICEAMLDSKLTDSDIEALSKLNMFFIYSKDDPTVIPDLYEIPTINRINKYHPSNIQVFTSNQVIDTSGKFLNEEGKPYKYPGHWSWVYFFNNEAKDNKNNLDIFTWIKTVTDKGK